MPDAAPEVQTRRRTAELDGVRAVAMLSVFAFHYAVGLTPLLRVGVPSWPLALRGYAILPNLDMGVEIFFVLSGYLIFRPFVAANLTGASRPGLRDYALRRAVRIYPAYWAALLVLWAVGWVHFEGGASVRHVVTEVLLVHTYFTDATIDGIPQSWTLVVEVSFYAFVPLLAWALSRTRLRGHVVTLVALTAVGFAARWYLLDHTLPRALTVLPPAMAALAPGMLLAVVDVTAVHERVPWAWLRRALVTTGAWWTVALVAFLVMTEHAATNPVFALRTRVQEGWHQPLAAVVAATLVAPLVLRGRGGGAGRAVMRAGPLAWIGVVSYGAYLWHFAVMFHLNSSSTSRHGFWHYVLVGLLILALTLAIAATSWYLLERPVLRLAHRSRGTPRPEHWRRRPRTLSA
jgi:peptidoglycan/LPS O-acetylase OafA/YrhL